MMEEGFKVSPDHPLFHIMKHFDETMMVSLVHVREQLVDDGLRNYTSLVQKREKLLRDIFNNDKPKINALMSSKSTILLALTAKGNQSNESFVVLSVLLLHCFSGGGYISSAATHQGRFGTAFHSKGDKLPYQNRGLFKALMLLASEVCLVFCGTHNIYLQMRSADGAKDLYQ
jgi:hypothetical protein